MTLTTSSPPPPAILRLPLPGSRAGCRLCVRERGHHKHYHCVVSPDVGAKFTDLDSYMNDGKRPKWCPLEAESVPAPVPDQLKPACGRQLRNRGSKKGQVLDRAVSASAISEARSIAERLLHLAKSALREDAPVGIRRETVMNVYMGVRVLAGHLGVEVNVGDLALDAPAKEEEPGELSSGPLPAPFDEAREMIVPDHFMGVMHELEALDRYIVRRYALIGREVGDRTVLGVSQ